MATSNAHALVTGGTSGIGYDLANPLAADGRGWLQYHPRGPHLERTATELNQQYQVAIAE